MLQPQLTWLNTVFSISVKFSKVLSLSSDYATRGVDGCVNYLIQVFKIDLGLDNLKFDDFLSYQIILEQKGIVLNLPSSIPGLMLGSFSSLLDLLMNGNCLPDTLVCAVNVNAFKNGLLRTVGVFRLST